MAINLSSNYLKNSFNQFQLDHFYQYCLLIMDLILMGHNYIEAVQLAMFSSIMAVMGEYHRYTILYIIKNLKLYASVFWRQQLPSKYSTLKLLKNQYRILHRLHNLHSYLCKIYMIMFGDLWSTRLFVFIISSIPFNIICLLALYHNDFSINLLPIILIAIINLIIIISTLLIMASQTETLHQSSKFIPNIVTNIHFDDHWRLKLMYDQWFYRLVTGKKYGPFVANIGQITYYKVLEVSRTNLNKKIF